MQCTHAPTGRGLVRRAASATKRSQRLGHEAFTAWTPKMLPKCHTLYNPLIPLCTPTMLCTTARTLFCYIRSFPCVKGMCVTASLPATAGNIHGESESSGDAHDADCLQEMMVQDSYGEMDCGCGCVRQKSCEEPGEMVVAHVCACMLMLLQCTSSTASSSAEDAFHT